MFLFLLFAAVVWSKRPFVIIDFPSMFCPVAPSTSDEDIRSLAVAANTFLDMLDIRSQVVFASSLPTNHPRLTSCFQKLPIALVNRIKAYGVAYTPRLGYESKVYFYDRLLEVLHNQASIHKTLVISMSADDQDFKDFKRKGESLGNLSCRGIRLLKCPSVEDLIWQLNWSSRLLPTFMYSLPRNIRFKSFAITLAEEEIQCTIS